MPTRVQVKLGRTSVNTVEVVEGLAGRGQSDPFGHVGVGMRSTGSGCADEIWN